jgi:hypothetical protein
MIEDKHPHQLVLWWDIEGQHPLQLVLWVEEDRSSGQSSDLGVVRSPEQKTWLGDLIL